MDPSFTYHTILNLWKILLYCLEVCSDHTASQMESLEPRHRSPKEKTHSGEQNKGKTETSHLLPRSWKAEVEIQRDQDYWLFQSIQQESVGTRCPWVGPRQPSLAASNAMCSHSVPRKAASDRSRPGPSGPRCWVVPPRVMAPLLCHLPRSTVTASREGLERQTLAVNWQTMTFQKKCQNLFEGIDADTRPFQKAIATPFVVPLDLQGKTVSQKLWPCHQKYLGEYYLDFIDTHGAESLALSWSECFTKHNILTEALKPKKKKQSQ